MKSFKPIDWPDNEHWPPKNGIYITRIIGSQPPIFILSNNRKIIGKPSSGIKSHRPKNPSEPMPTEWPKKRKWPPLSPIVRVYDKPTTIFELADGTLVIGKGKKKSKPRRGTPENTP